jgi:hypothetical protein
VFDENVIFLTSVNSLSSAASVSPFCSARTTGLISFLRPFTLFFGLVFAGASLSITTVDKQSRKSSKLDTSSEAIISVTQILVGVDADQHEQARSNKAQNSFQKTIRRDSFACLTSDLDLNSMVDLLEPE